ncbi:MULTISPECIES: glutathione transferase GstA [unclassified Massilia]|uniref:glutathione transferase GstA n=1 Tax=unclassified Massilia TaxID=2609279 RepID=UPI0017853684|nr:MULTISPECIES: glutathione transferase GstA [unclassified Massilia]MBD8530882.1 glutathione transferase GstA [Massilia sp. CFBP 13647]MBD8674582.1 glutathione transferase GstA [Massilia sp. CFBP 13721]
MKLYFSPGACSLSPHIVLLEAGLDFSAERVDLRAKLTAGGADFRAINPKGYVPALALDDGSVLTEGPAIVQFLADLAPGAGLLPPVGDAARYKIISWLSFISSELHKNFNAFFNPAASDDMKAHARKILAVRLEYVAAQLGNGDYLEGGFSVADAYLFTALGWADVVKLDLAAWPVLGAYRARIGARPAVQQALRAEGLIK